MASCRRTRLFLAMLALLVLLSGPNKSRAEQRGVNVNAVEKQITNGATGHVLTNTNVWSPDSQWIVYDTRSDASGEKFDGSTIEVVNVKSGEVQQVYRSQHGAHCGVATFSPRDNRVVFILGPENPTEDWQYNAWHRQGAIVDIRRPQIVTLLDARDVVAPFTPGALRGGSHVHVFDGEGEWVSFTYEDHVLASLDAKIEKGEQDTNQRNIGISVPTHPVKVPRTNPRNQDGSRFSVLATRTVNHPRPRSDEISKAFEEGWVGERGYVRADGTLQRRAIAFQGLVVTQGGKPISEVFIVDLPDDVTNAGDAPLEGTSTTRPAPPRGAQQRRLTHTTDRKYPGIQGPRHWLRSSPESSQIGFLMRDDSGVVQFWTVSPTGGAPVQVTHNSFDIGSAFSWSPDGKSIAYVGDNSVVATEVHSGITTRLTPRSDDATAPRPEACVYSPDGNAITFVRRVAKDGETHNQIFMVTLR